LGNTTNTTITKEHSMSPRRITRIVATGTIALVGFGSLAAIPVVSASAATHSVRVHSDAASRRDTTRESQRGNSQDATSDSVNDATGIGKDVGPSSDIGSDKGTTDKSVSTDPVSTSSDHVDSLA
jgi:hypothetical protein